ncbi:unnamed protein product [Nippostrongylus brasiliensis]|uniref:Transposase n=1 Tax=Nippostrongylus brasiliensis TaxID=27835 RepID=A0A0N4XVY8_NIPBR|nr:unnamed protein product [Nippostrongylus brasiliensis]
MNYIICRLRKEDPRKSTNNIIAQNNMQPGWRRKNDVPSMVLRYAENNPYGIRHFEPPHDQIIVTPTMLRWLKYSSDGIS